MNKMEIKKQKVIFESLKTFKGEKNGNPNY